MAKRIDFEVGYTDKGAKAGFDNLNKSISQTSVTAGGKLQPSLQQSNMQLQSMSRIVQDMPYGFMGVSNNITFMAEQMGYAKSQGISFGAMLKGMLTSLTGVGGIIFAISAVTSLLTVFGDELFSSSEAADTAKDAVKGLREEFDGLKESIEGLAKAGDLNQLNLLTQRRSGLYALSDAIRKQLQVGGQDTFERLKLKSQLQSYQDEIKRINEEVNFIVFAWEKYVGKIKESNKSLNEQKDIVTEIWQAMRPVAAGEGDLFARSPLGDSGVGSGIDRRRNKGRAFMGGLTESFKEAQKLTEELAVSGSAVFRSEFISGWEDIFGEANSMFEKLMAKWAEDLIMKVGTNFLTGFIGSIIPGFGDFFSFSRLTSAGNATAARYGMGK